VTENRKFAVPEQGMKFGFQGFHVAIAIIYQGPIQVGS
jgi:hypothetical protein